MPFGGALIGGLAGVAGGLMGGGKKSGQDAGNLFANGGESGDVQGLSAYALRDRAYDAMNKNRNINYSSAVANAQNNPMLSGLFGQGGALSRAGTEEQRLASQGYQLQPEDHEAYGQASGNIARMFGQQEQSLAQSLADRGLSNSGVAGQQFSGLMGNKQEQLAGLQTQIADKRMKMNMDRLAQTRQFMGQMGNQAQNAIQQGYDIPNQNNQQEFNMNAGWLKNQQGANENALTARQGGSSSQPGFGDALMGGMGGALGGARLGGALGGGGGAKPGLFGGQSYTNGGSIA